MDGANGHNTTDLLLGKLLERSDQQIWWMRRVDARLEHGDYRMTQTQITVAQLEVEQRRHAAEIDRLRKVKAEEPKKSRSEAIREVMETIQTLRSWVTWAVIIIMSIIAMSAPAEVKGIALKWLQANVATEHDAH